jgi:hypothetical protein
VPADQRPRHGTQPRLEPLSQRWRRLTGAQNSLEIP